MPYNLVLTKNGANDEVCAVPEGWVVGLYLYWPRLLKKSEIESLRSNEKSIPDKSWKKMKCRLKLSDIGSFKEALRLEDLYSKFQDTEDEEMYLKERENKKKKPHLNALSKQLLDLNSEFDRVENTDHIMHSVDENNIILNEISFEEINENPDKIISQNVANSDEVNVQVLSTKDQDNYVVENNITKNEISYEEVKKKPDKIVSQNVANSDEVLGTESQNNIQVTLNDAQGTSSNDETLTITTSELLKLVQENNSLQTENKVLKEELLNTAEFQKETKKNFSIMQTQLDKMIELLQNQSNSSTQLVSTNDGLSTNKDNIFQIIIGNVKFPIGTREELDHLENKLVDKDIMTYLVKKFSQIFGTRGATKFNKVGLHLMKELITDELLNQFTWKGIKGSSKMAFLQYIKIRELIYRVAHLADKTCSFSDTDLFIQNSAIKHSGQRMKRRILSSAKEMNVKQTKKERNKIDRDTIQMDEEKFEYHEDQNDENRDSSNNLKLQESTIKNAADDFTNIQNQPSCSKISILSDVKISNKALDIKDVNKMANISSTDVNYFFDELIKF